MKRRPVGHTNVFAIFTDISMLMLGTFIFLMVMILLTSRMTQEYEVPKIKAEIQDLKNKLAAAEMEAAHLSGSLEQIVMSAEGNALDNAIQTSTFGKKDFDVFIEGLKNLPGKDLHLVIDASGSMHGLTSFLIPILRVIVVRSGKELSAITWFSDGNADTYTGTMGEMFDRLISGAPFGGNMETIGNAFRYASRHAAAPGAYLLIGDEPSDDSINFSEILAPVYTLPLGRSDPDTNREYQRIALQTGGRMLQLDFR